MNEQVRRRRNGRNKVNAFKKIFFTIGAFILFLWDALRDDFGLMWRHGRLFVGMGMVGIGMFSYVSGVHCDGNVSDHFSCTRPTTYYYYPWWAILFVIFGSFFIVLWFLRRKKK